MNEGDFAQISCIVTSGDQPLTISWSFHGNGEGEGEAGITTTNLGSRLSMLVIEAVEHHHQGLYTCQAKNGAGITSYTAELKVNGKQSDSVSEVAEVLLRSWKYFILSTKYWLTVSPL